MRIDQQLERNQNIRNLRQRFLGIFWAFEPQDYDHPITRQSISDALSNIERALAKELNR